MQDHTVYLTTAEANDIRRAVAIRSNFGEGTTSITNTEGTTTRIFKLGECVGRIVHAPEGDIFQRATYSTDRDQVSGWVNV